MDVFMVDTDFVKSGTIGFTNVSVEEDMSKLLRARLAEWLNVFGNEVE